ncbi:UPF0182 family membrane protein [Lyngbya confervoides]|uniref:UPF0182 protein QQ91_0003385 n=1 Tax=Lyngbya confervoides BDU141951 TaxID=1574623 RepID=A0ABD4SZZ1_9CYAN|nr:UPF0182 family protein [Lyngbya confervoides]MCM1981874.1 UPF0182 family protein [Lyngbya confervoides BDU141951]
MSVASKIILGLCIVLFIGIPAGGALIHLLTESWWFEALGYSSVYWTTLTWQGILGLITFTLYVTVLGVHYGLAHRLTRDRPYQFFAYSELQPYSQSLVRSISLLIIGFVALVAANNSSSAWTRAPEFLQGQSFHQTDPIFNRDLGFYLFQLPFLELLRQIFLMLATWSLVLIFSIYSLKGIFTEANRLFEPSSLERGIKIHLGLAIAALILLLGWGFWLGQYHLLTRQSGVVFGIGFTDYHARLLSHRLMSMVTVGVAMAVLVSLWRRGLRPIIIALTLFGLAFVSLEGIYPWLVQSLIVRPNELAKEKPFLAHNIRYTQAAYHLEQVQNEKYDVQAGLTLDKLQENQTTLENVRLWDYQPLLKTYRQLQEIRSYYRFQDVDVDRYRLQGQLRAVMLSARELDLSQLPSQAQTWVNQQLKYTHGHGLVMSPVNQVSTEGLPEFYIQNIPPQSRLAPQVENPDIYYGELTQSPIFTGTTTDEFDYPQGSGNVFNRYDGLGGVPLDSLGRRLAYALDLSHLQLLISDYFNSQTRIHYDRQVRQRVQHIAPFLRYDSDPYLAIIDGKLNWIIDAYTTSDRYPYAEPINPQINGNDRPASLHRLTQGNINYIRNAVKVVVDAYDGTVLFYVIDPSDPIVQTYQRIFPNLFRAPTTIPDSLRRHFRYPEDLFRIQTSLFLNYHMSDPEVFYNREDLWQLPTQVYEDQAIVMEPYYVIMRLPGATEPEFILIQPLTPNQKDNMIAWMAARTDGEQYGKIILFNFPKQSLVFGPRQIEARIDQDPTISQQLTLWSQSGSKVIRGNLIIFPIERSLLYVEPIYLRAEQAELPQLKRVIVAYDQSIVMAETFAEALTQIFGEEKTATPPPSEDSVSSASPLFDQLAQQALETHQQADAAARAGQWSRFGQLQQRLRDILQRLNQSPPSR